jgi:hypothetical protein
VCCATAWGEFEDRFFSTVFLGSGLLFLAMLFASAAMAGGIILARRAARLGNVHLRPWRNVRDHEHLRSQDGAVFMISTSTLAIRTGFTPRWIALIGYAFALLLLFSGRYVDWIIMVFPLWVLLISIYILIDNFRRAPETPTRSGGREPPRFGH